MASADHAPDPARLTAATRKEEAMWLLERLVPGSGVNNVPGAAVRVDGRLDPGLLRAAATALLRRHPALRTVFHAGETTLGKQVLAPREATLPLEHASVADADLEAALTGFTTRPFELDGSPLARLAHFSLDDAKADVLCLAVHHLVFDNTSCTVFLEEFAVVYDLAAAGKDLYEIPVEEVPSWQEPEPDRHSLTFWRSHLDGLDPRSGELWIGARPAGSGSVASKRTRHVLSQDAVDVIGRAQREFRAPHTVVLLAAYYLLLARHGAGSDFAVGVPVDVREQKAQRDIGYHVNILPLRAAVDLRRTFREFVRSVRDGFLESVAQASAPVDVLLLEAPRIGDTWRSSLFRHVFNFLPGRGTREYRIGGLQGVMRTVETGTSKFDLEFIVEPMGAGFDVTAVYSTAVHTDEEVALLLGRYDAILAALGADPDLVLADVPVWCVQDLATIGVADARAAAPNVVGTIAAHAARLPDSVAVQAPGATTSYGRLWQAAVVNRDELLAQGAGPGSLVGLPAARGAESIAAALGIWLAGAAYQAVDADAADDGPVTALLTTSGADGLRTVSVPMARISEDEPESAPAHAANPDPRARACVLRDGSGSGDTAPVAHDRLSALVRDLAGSVADGTPVDALWRSPLSAAASLAEVWLPLATGGKIVAVQDDAALAQALHADPAALLAARTNEWWRFPDVVDHELAGRPVFVGPEQLTPGLAARLLAGGARVFAVRGDARSGGWWGIAEIDDAHARPLGDARPLAATGLTVTAPDGYELPIGVRGEIRVASGAPGRAATGTSARWTSRGTLEVVGETDRALWRRGVEVAPEQVEALFAEHPGVAAVAVVSLPPRGDAEEPTLVALVQRGHAGDQNPDAEVPRLGDALREHAQGALPRGAVPDVIAVVEALPLAADGSLDRASLAALAERAVAEQAEAPADEAASEYLPLLIALWRELIGREDLDSSSNFFACGGHSLLAAMLLQRVEEQTDIELSLADAFEHPTPAALAARLAAVVRAAAAASAA
jgi:acyl-CoA synthetase (AMP-forming)/AMP-acid ligase II